MTMFPSDEKDNLSGKDRKTWNRDLFTPEQKDRHELKSLTKGLVAMFVWPRLQPRTSRYVRYYTTINSASLLRLPLFSLDGFALVR